jgi:hypothetical protein
VPFGVRRVLRNVARRRRYFNRRVHGDVGDPLVHALRDTKVLCRGLCRGAKVQIAARLEPFLGSLGSYGRQVVGKTKVPRVLVSEKGILPERVAGLELKLRERGMPVRPGLLYLFDDQAAVGMPAKGAEAVGVGRESVAGVAKVQPPARRLRFTL